MADAPDPLVPAEVDLTDFGFMPLEVNRLLASDWWITACAEDPRRAMAAVNLWAAAWHQLPAASLPSKPVVLAKLAMVDAATWKEIGEAVMEPWVLCADGRLYHPVVAEHAIESWHRKQQAAERRQQHREKMKSWREAKHREENSEQNQGEPSRDRHVTSLTGTGTGTGTKERERAKALLSEAAPSDDGSGGGGEGADPPADAPEPVEGYTAEFEAFWKVYPRKTQKGAAFRAFRRVKKLAPVTKILEGASRYAKLRYGQDPQFTQHPATWLNGHGWNDETGPQAAAGPPMTEREKALAIIAKRKPFKPGDL